MSLILAASALAVTSLVSYGIVEAGLALAGHSRAGKGAVMVLALVTGLAFPWIAVDVARSVLVGGGEDA